MPYGGSGNEHRTRPARAGRQHAATGEPLELRARPRPVTRINRKLLAAVAGLGLFFLAGLVMVALNPPNWRNAGPPTELYNVDNKPKSDGLARLPATYEGLGTTRRATGSESADRPAAGGPRRRERARAGRARAPRPARRAGPRVGAVLPAAAEITGA